jgi:hypothetical protein
MLCISHCIKGRARLDPGGHVRGRTDGPGFKPCRTTAQQYEIESPLPRQITTMPLKGVRNPCDHNINTFRPNKSLSTKLAHIADTTFFRLIITVVTAASMFPYTDNHLSLIFLASSGEPLNKKIDIRLYAASPAIESSRTPYVI